MALTILRSMPDGVRPTALHWRVIAKRCRLKKSQIFLYFGSLEKAGWLIRRVLRLKSGDVSLYQIVSKMQGSLFRARKAGQHDRSGTGPGAVVKHANKKHTEATLETDVEIQGKAPPFAVDRSPENRTAIQIHKYKSKDQNPAAPVFGPLAVEKIRRIEARDRRERLEAGANVRGDALRREAHAGAGPQAEDFGAKLKPEVIERLRKRFGGGNG